MGLNMGKAGYREIGAELRKLRMAAGMVASHVAKSTGWSQSKISRMESGKVDISVADLTWYLGILRVPHDRAVPLIDLCRVAKGSSGFWLSEDFPSNIASLSTLIYFETTAQRSFSFESELVPGLLQTERYARAVMGKSVHDEGEVDFGVETRLDRQKVLQKRGYSQRFFIHEHALRLPVGGPEVMHEQMLALTLAGATPNIEVRVVPISAAERSVCGGAFRLLDFESYSPLVMLGAYLGDFWLENMRHVTSYQRLVPELAEVALSENESRELITELADDYDKAHASSRAEATRELVG